MKNSDIYVLTLLKDVLCFYQFPVAVFAKKPTFEDLMNHENFQTEDRLFDEKLAKCIVNHGYVTGIIKNDRLGNDTIFSYRLINPDENGDLHLTERSCTNYIGNSDDECIVIK